MKVTSAISETLPSLSVALTLRVFGPCGSLRLSVVRRLVPPGYFVSFQVIPPSSEYSNPLAILLVSS